MNDPVRHHTADLTDVTMHFVTAGDGAEPVVLLHGWPQTWYEWRKVIPHLTSAGYRIVAPDLRGLGDTSRPAHGCDSASAARDILELAQDQLGLSRFHIVGHDWGGPTAFAVATAAPAAVGTLTMVDVTVPGIGPDISQGGRRWHHAFHMVPDLPEALTEGRERTYLEWFYRSFAHQADAITPADIDEYLRTYARPGALGASFGYYRSIPDNVAANQALKGSGFQLTMPVLAVGGACTEARGRASEPAASLREIADDVTEAVVDGSGHFVPEEQPAAFASTLCAFLGRHPLRT